jgi:hypothetical protein
MKRPNPDRAAAIVAAAAAYQQLVTAETLLGKFDTRLATFAADLAADTSALMAETAQKPRRVIDIEETCS